MKAKTREQYTSAWHAHINDLIHVFLDANAPINDWEEVKTELFATVEDAADSLFPVTNKEAQQ